MVPFLLREQHLANAGGVQVGCGDREVKQAYKHMALAWHPDVQIRPVPASSLEGCIAAFFK